MLMFFEELSKKMQARRPLGSCAIILFFIIQTATGDLRCLRKGGKCQENSIPCDNYQKGLCNGGRTRQCCISNQVADKPCRDKGGKCQQTSVSCRGTYTSGLCGGSASRKCCVPQSGSASCSAAAAAVACKIKNSSKITLLKINPSQVKDEADPYSNIRDACARKVAKRSSYKCREGQAPGGSTCLDLKILQYIYNLGTSTKYQVQVNAIAGACHSNGSKHYDGKAVDFQLFGSGTAKAAQEKAFRDECTKHKGWSHGGTHVHCQIV
ncbi:uncharacterized protein LOC128157124 isoform X1 [Crassostrea angulata]|uniref:uncharacterized protein LOC128157124 isoform X1 n=1 Tax=Magallana angulata TaxID=2784310 RepID=UPI0022B1A05A|nr:uncharacterized protein LOC128157124 isoform X1 [Crassostrea angulata]